MEGVAVKKAELRLTISAIAICGVLNSTACRAESNPSLGRQFIDGHNTVSFSVLVPGSLREDEKRVERVKVTCDEGKCRVQVASISQRACGGGMTYQGRGFVPFDEMIQINDYGPEEKDPMSRPKVTSGDDGMLIVQFIDFGQETRLRVLLRWEKSEMPSREPFIAAGGVVGEADVWQPNFTPHRFAPISEIVGSPIICHARFQSR
jgi:hypothetical protein